MSNILVVNSGSSSIKFKLYKNLEEVAVGSFKRYDQDSCVLDFDGEKKDITAEEYDSAISKIAEILDKQIDSIGFRVVHGAEVFRDITEIKDDFLDKVESLKDLAPLHNPPAIHNIRESMKAFGDNVRKFAVFDTQFYVDIPEKSYLYGLPYELYTDHKIRKYGFHGISHEYLNEEVRRVFGAENVRKIITCHLGGGSSVTASYDGRALDTSMGFTPLDGLVMATRCGDLDPGIVKYLLDKGFDINDLYNTLNQKSGILGLSGESADMIKILDMYKKGKENGMRAFDKYIYSIQKFIGSYISVLGGVDCLVISGGIGSGSDIIRKHIVEKFDYYGMSINEEINNGRIDVDEFLDISGEDSKCKIVTLPTNEESIIAKKVSSQLDS